MRSLGRPTPILVLGLGVALSLTLSARGIAFKVYEAQDFGAHFGMIALAQSEPYQFWFHPLPDRANPPLFFAVGAGFRLLFGPDRYLPVLSSVIAIANVAAVVVFALALKRFFLNPWLWTTVVLGLLFLPAFLVTSAAIATDGLFTLLYLLIMVLLLRMIETRSERRQLGYAVAACILLCALNLTKLSGLFLVAVVWIFVCYMLWRRLLTNARWKIVGVIAIIPTILVVLQFAIYEPTYSRPFAIDRSVNPFKSHFMSVRSLVAPRGDDASTLSAPPYNLSTAGNLTDTSGRDMKGNPAELLIPNIHSYPALLNLSIFSDVLNRFQYEPVRTYFGTRTATAQALMSMTVKLGAVFFLIVALASPVATAYWSVRALRRFDAEAISLSLVGLAGFALLVGLMVNLPFTPSAYGGGAWTARYVMPSIILFAFLTGVTVDRCARRFGFGVITVSAASVALVSILEMSFLWTGLWGYD